MLVNKSEIINESLNLTIINNYILFAFIDPIAILHILKMWNFPKSDNYFSLAHFYNTEKCEVTKIRIF